MYRPLNWKNPYPKHIHEHDDYEEGADAILEGLREGGVTDTFYTNKDGEVCGNKGFFMYVPCKDAPVSGTVVFIPDEQVKKD